MLFSERQKIVIKYRNWLVEEMLKNSFHIKDDPETFLVFLEMNGYLTKGEQDERSKIL